MIHAPVWLLLASFAFHGPAPLAPAPASSSAPQDEEEQAVADERPEIQEMLGELKDHLDDKGKQDDAAIAVIDKLTMEFPKSGPKDRASVVDALADVFDLKRPKELEEGVPDTRAYDAAAAALSTMAPESVEPLIKAVDHKNLKKLLATRARVIQALGKTRGLEGVKPLRDLLKDKDVEIVSAAGQALGYYSEAPQEVRKEAFEDVLKTLMSAKGNSDADPNDPIARERYQAIGASMITALGALSGHEERVPEEWQHWWNKNKKEDWDAAKG